MASLDDALVTRFPNLEAGDVREVVDTEADDSQLNTYLNMAYYRTRPLAGNLSACGGINAEREIIKLIAAHFAKIYEGGEPYDEWVGVEWRVRYKGNQFGDGLLTTNFGGMAIAMDCSGQLASSGKPKSDIYVADTDRAEEKDIVVN